MNLGGFVTNILRNIIHSLIASHYEPQIKQKRDQNGSQYWQVYDFKTNKSYTFASEQDVRVWIENRYHSF